MSFSQNAERGQKKSCVASSDSQFEKTIRSNIYELQDQLRVMKEDVELPASSAIASKLERSLERCRELQHATEWEFQRWMESPDSDRTQTDRRRKQISCEKLSDSFNESLGQLQEVRRQAAFVQRAALNAGADIEDSGCLLESEDDAVETLPADRQKGSKKLMLLWLIMAAGLFVCVFALVHHTIWSLPLSLPAAAVAASGTRPSSLEATGSSPVSVSGGDGSFLGKQVTVIGARAAFKYGQALTA
jgi:hypothetical protein